MFWERYAFTVNAIGFASFLTLAITRPAASPVSRLLGRGILATLGKYSYAMYLFHLPLRALVRDVIYGPNGGKLGAFATFHGSQIPGQLIYYAISLTITFIAAWLSWNLYEKHFLRLKRWFHSPKPRRVPAPATIIAPTSTT
jgi:peptidoglycan/LPS O-acetylase OafA/YrhL